MPDSRKHVYYSGLVQGVGFRFTARRLASECSVAGYVRNLPDGRVEIVAEGDTAELTRFLALVHQQMDTYIHRANEDDESPTGEFHGFDVRF